MIIKTNKTFCTVLLRFVTKRQVFSRKKLYIYVGKIIVKWRLVMSLASIKIELLRDVKEQNISLVKSFGFQSVPIYDTTEKQIAQFLYEMTPKY